MIDIYNIQDFLENDEILMILMILIFKNEIYLILKHFNEIKDNKKNLLFILEIENRIYIKHEKILRDKIIVFRKFPIKFNEFVNL